MGSTKLGDFERILEESRKHNRNQPWGQCPHCGKIRHFTKRHGMTEHNYYDYHWKQMLPCPGLWCPPVRTLTQKEKDDKNGYHITQP